MIRETNVSGAGVKKTIDVALYARKTVLRERTWSSIDAEGLAIQNIFAHLAIKHILLVTSVCVRRASIFLLYGARIAIQLL